MISVQPSNSTASAGQVGGPRDNLNGVAHEAKPAIGFNAAGAGSGRVVVAHDGAVSALLPGEGFGVVGVGSVPGDVGHVSTVQPIPAGVNAAETSQLHNTGRPA